MIFSFCYRKFEFKTINYKLYENCFYFRCAGLHLPARCEQYVTVSAHIGKHLHNNIAAYFLCYAHQTFICETVS